MSQWNHTRKGRVVGDLVREDETWMWVRLSGEHRLRWMAGGNRGTVNDDGEVMCFRRSFMAEVTQ